MSSSGAAERTIELNNGVKMPIFGLGTFMSQREEMKSAVKAALDAGYRHLDTAAAYQNEASIGEALSEYFATGKLTRSDVFITTKLWWTKNHPDASEQCLRDQLAQLQTDYVDLYLVHMPATLREDLGSLDESVTLEQIWSGMERIHAQGLARAIGLSNVTVEQIERVHRVAKVPIHSVQVELHLYFAQPELQRVCRKHNISLTAYAPLGAPSRVNVPLPIGKGQFVNSAAPEPLKDAAVVALAAKYGKTPAQILLRHLVQRRIAVIPKSANPKRIAENIDVFDFALTEAEMDKLNGAKQGERIYALDFMAGHPEDPFKSER